MATVDDFPSNSSTTGSVAPGRPLIGRLEVAGDHDWIKVWLQAGQLYSFGLTPPYLMGVDLLDQRGSVLRSFDYHPVYMAIGGDFSVAADGEYVLAVRNASVQEGGTPYTLNLQSKPLHDDIGDTAAGALAVGVGQTVNGRLDGPLDRDAISFPVLAGTTYTLALQAAALDGLAAALGGSQWLATDGQGHYAFTADQDGAFVAQLGQSGYQITQAQRDLAYTLAIGAAADDFGASAATAGRLAVGASVAGQLGLGDRDWIAVDLQAGQTYWFKLGGDPAMQGLQASVIDRDGYALEAAYLNQGFEAPVLAVKPGQSGTYYYAVQGRGTGAYQLTASLPGTDDVPDGAPLLLHDNRPQVGTFEVQGDSDSFRFDALAGHSYEIIVRGSTPPPAVVSGPNGTLHALGESAGDTAYYRTTAFNDRRHTIELDGSGMAPGTSYTLQVRDTGIDDHWDFLAERSVLLGNGSVSGTLDGALDADTFRVFLEQGRSYRFALTGGTLPGDAAGTLLLGSDDARPGGAWAVSPGGGPAVLEFTARWTGDYALSVVGHGARSGSYTVSASTSDGDTQAPTLLAGPPASLGLGAPLTLQFSEPVRAHAGLMRIVDGDGQLIVSGAQLAASAGADGSVAIATARLLQPGELLRLEWAPGAITDRTGNAYQGAASLRFATAPAAPSAGDDVLAGHGNGQAIAGGAGLDTVVYGGPRSSYQVSQAAGQFQVRAQGAASADVLSGIERLAFTDQAVALDGGGSAGQVFRLYQAAFNRAPDAVGLGFWIYQHDHGMGLDAIAAQFIASPEFTQLYGAAPGTAQFVDLLYQNVLHRAGEAGGVAHWNKVLDGGYPRAGVLAAFSESPENVAQLAPLTDAGFGYTPWSY